MRKLLVALVVLPLAAFAQGAPGGGQGRGQGPGNGPMQGNPERMEKRMRLARTLGLAEALDLDAPQALKLGESVAKFDERRLAARRQMHDAREVLFRAAKGEKVTAGEVDQAIQKALEARAQIQVVDRELVTAVTQGLTPEKKARAVLFLSKFQQRFGGPGMNPGGRGQGRGMGPGRGMGRGGGMGPAPMDDGDMMGVGPGPGGWADEED
jgi:hypothetical protein